MSTPPRDAARRPVKKERAIASKSIAAIAVAVLLIAFGIANSNDVRVNWLIVHSSTPLILVIGVSALLGAILGGVAARRLPPRASRGRR
jgi:uncharacterized integral membrane protein